MRRPDYPPRYRDEFELQDRHMKSIMDHAREIMEEQERLEALVKEKAADRKLKGKMPGRKAGKKDRHQD